jgi:hypothetical protein
MTNEERGDILKAMNELNISISRMDYFIDWSNNWGRFNLHGDWLWYEYSPLETKDKRTMTMEEMWNFYLINK